MIRKRDHNKNERAAQDKNGCLMKVEKHFHFEKIDSTNTWAKTHSDQWASAGVTLVIAAEQTAGRGRLKRRWESPPHVNIYATFCFWLRGESADIGHIPQLLALAAVQELEKEQFSPTIKWPNDVLLQGKKVAGILCETIVEENRRGVICGIGLNVNMPLEALLQIDRPATSLLVEGGRAFDVASLLEGLQKRFLNFLNEFLEKGFAPFFPLLQAKSALRKGQLVRFHDHQTMVEAQFEALHADGSIELRFSDGTTKRYYAGEFI